MKVSESFEQIHDAIIDLYINIKIEQAMKNKSQVIINNLLKAVKSWGIYNNKP